MPLTRLTLSSILILISSSASAEIEDTVILEPNWHLAIDDNSHSSNGSVWLPFETEITLPRPDADPSVGPFAGELYATGKCFVAGGEQSYYIPRWRERGTSANVFASDKGIKLWIAGANPTSSAIEIGFSLPASSKIDLSIFDLTGRRVATILNETRDAGNSRVRWCADGSVVSGVYFVQLNTDCEQHVQKVVMRR